MFKEGSHRCPILAVVELVEEQVVKEPEEVKQGRDNSSGARDGDHRSDDLHHGVKDLADQETRGVLEFDEMGDSVGARLVDDPRLASKVNNANCAGQSLADGLVGAERGGAGECAQTMFLEEIVLAVFFEEVVGLLVGDASGSEGCPHPGVVNELD